MVAILNCFEAVFTLQVNFNKSTIFGIHVEDRLLHHFAEMLGCKTGSFPTSYLGLPLSTGRISKSFWNPMVERVEFKLASWKANCMSIGGRVTLIKSALANLPFYFMSLFKCSMSVVYWIENLERGFPWQGRDVKKRNSI